MSSAARSELSVLVGRGLGVRLVRKAAGELLLALDRLPDEPLGRRLVVADALGGGGVLRRRRGRRALGGDRRLLGARLVAAARRQYDQSVGCKQKAGARGAQAVGTPVGAGRLALLVDVLPDFRGRLGEGPAVDAQRVLASSAPAVPCACCLGWCSLSTRPNRLLEPLGSGTILTTGVLRHGLRSACRERLTLAGTFH